MWGLLQEERPRNDIVLVEGEGTYILTNPNYRISGKANNRLFFYPPATLAVAAERVCTFNFSKIAFK